MTQPDPRRKKRNQITKYIQHTDLTLSLFSSYTNAKKILNLASFTVKFSLCQKNLENNKISNSDLFIQIFCTTLDNRIFYKTILFDLET